jgi:energy-coupling factor transporter ATP-binding protein EcfA2
MNSSRPSAFVAYTDRDKELSKVIFNGISKANSVDACPTRYEPWEYNDISGTHLLSPILEGIDASPFVVADITYLNPNVVYEIGFAIGRKKKVLLIRNSDYEGDWDIAKTVGIFDTIGYSSYRTEDDLRNKLTSHVSNHALPFEVTVNNKAPVYVMPNNGKSSASTHLIGRVKKARYRYRSFSSTEDVRLSATDAIAQVAQSAGVITMLDDDNIEQTVRALFIAGLADGMNKPSLLLSPYMAETPLDVRDKAKLYKDQNDIVDIVADFCPEINAKLQESSPPPIIAPNLLGRISVGDPTAENEMTTLENYYLQTDQYLRASRGEVNLVVGRKGSGKTALFIRLRDTTRSDKRNIVVDLKPESYQLLKLKDEILEHLAEGSKQHLITAFWEYLILLEVTYKLLEKDRNSHRFNHNIRDLYEKLESIYTGSEGISEGDFSERIMQLSQRLSENYSSKVHENENKITGQNLTELLYTHDLKALKKALSRYLEHKRNILVLFDNLDKSWSTIGVDRTDAITLRCLIDASRKVERDMQKRGHEFRCIVFVRNDVYQHLMANSPDYGKEMRATLDWSDTDLLRELLRLRLISNLDEEFKEAGFQDIWAGISESHVFGEETSSFLIDRSLMRPRNVLKLFGHARAFAVNFRKEKIDQEDFYKGLKTYSQDLLIELDRELSDVFPDAKDLLYYFIDSPSIITVDQLYNVMSEAAIPEERQETIRNFLLYHGVIGLRLDDKDQYIFDVGYDLKQILIRVTRLGTEARFVLNPAFAPALEIKDQLFEQQSSFALK